MDSNESLEHVFEKMRELLQGLKYGSVTVVVQDGKIVQIEKSEKVRL